MPPEASKRMLIPSQMGFWEQKGWFGMVWEQSGQAEENSHSFSASLSGKFTFKSPIQAPLQHFVLF